MSATDNDDTSSAAAATAATESSSASVPTPPVPLSTPGSAGGSAKRYQRSDFELHETLGEGSFGQVFRTTHLESGRDYAVKVLSKRHLMRSGMVEEVKRERDVLNLLKHPNIIKLFCTFQDDHNLYIVLELCPGGELFSHIQKLGSLSVECARFVAAEVVLALEYMHGMGVVHRDLKPENIIFAEDKHVRVTDFGTALILRGADGTAMSTSVVASPVAASAPGGGSAGGADTTSFKGTPEYVSPELLRNEPVNASADMWALGCIIFQMLAGKPPFRGGSDYLTFQQVLARDFKFPSSFPEHARTLVDSLLQLNPASRPTASAMRAHPFFDGVDWDALGTSTPPELTPFVMPGVVTGSERERLLQEQEQSGWAKFLIPNELIVYSGLVIKKVGLSSKKRQLILTDTPRMIYIDPNNMVQKGEIPWSDKVRPEIKNERQFMLHVPGRTYYLEDISLNAAKWVEHVQQLRDRLASGR